MLLKCRILVLEADINAQLAVRSSTSNTLVRFGLSKYTQNRKMIAIFTFGVPTELVMLSLNGVGNNSIFLY